MEMLNMKMQEMKMINFDDDQLFDDGHIFYDDKVLMMNQF